MPHFAFIVTPQFARLFHWFALLIYGVYGARYTYRGFRYVRSRVAYLAALKRIHQRWCETTLAYHPCDFGTVEALRGTKIALFTQRMEALGFVHLEDYESGDATVDALLHAPPAPPLAAPTAPPVAAKNGTQQRYYSTVYARVFSHPAHGCLGSICYTVSKDLRKPEWVSFGFSVDICSLSGHEAGDWLYYTAMASTIHKYNPARILLNRPRHLSTRMAKVTYAQLLAKHLQRRAQIARVTGISWRRELSTNDFIKTNEEAIARLRRVSQQMTWVQTVWRVFWFLREVKKEPEATEWLGELERRL